MATVVDSLIVTLGLDPSDFDKGSKQAAAAFLKTRDAAKAAGKDIEDSSKFASSAIDRITKSALGFFGVLLGANSIKDFVAGVVSSNVALGNLSANLGISAQELARWQNAAATVGDTADGAAGAIHAASDQLVGLRTNAISLPPTLLRLFGQSGVTPDLTGTTSQYLSDVARAAAIYEKQYGRQSTAYLLEQGGLGGLENLLLSGNAGARLAQAPAPTTQSIQNSQDLNTKFQHLVQTASTQAGNIFGENVAPILSGDVDTLQNAGFDKDLSLAAGLANPAGVGAAIGGFISDVVRNLQGGSGASAATTGTASVSDQEAYIRQKAAALGIDPDTAVLVARHEGLGNAYAGDKGSSFGDYQLHYGGVSKQYPNAGLGDAFTKATGLDARDPSTWQAQIDYALAQVRTNGWSAFMGAAAAGVSRYQGVGSTNVNIDAINISVPNGDATQIAANIAAAVKRSSMANLANSGSN